MSRAHSSYIPAEEIAEASSWTFDAVDQASLRFAAKVKAQAEAQDRARDEAARQAGYSEGFEQGAAQATEECQRQINEYIATQGQDAARHFAALFASGQEQIEQSQQVMAQGVLELACELARQIVRRELRTQTDALQPVVREALGMLHVDAKLAAVRMHPSDLELLGDALQHEFSNLKLSLVPDAGITPGGCMVESAGTVVDGTLERRWQRAVAGLGLDAAWEVQP